MKLTTGLMIALCVAAGAGLPSMRTSAQVVSPDPDSNAGKVAVIRCVTDARGSITVGNSSVTTLAGVSVQQGDRCAATIAALQRAGMRMLGGPQVTPNPFDRDLSFSFVFIAGYYYDDDHDDDCDDDYDDYFDDCDDDYDDRYDD